MTVHARSIGQVILLVYRSHMTLTVRSLYHGSLLASAEPTSERESTVKERA